MSQEVRALEPKSMWNHFADLNEIPRASKKEERVIAFVKSFGENLGLPTMVDEVGNVIIKKPATPGMENRKVIALQSHLDMVHQKNAETNFDFDTEGIKMNVDGDWVKAAGTTLGADNGIGVASIMALLSSTHIPHPAIEALFTIDEETGMTGAMGLKGGLLTAEIMLNLDTEDDDELTIGCAGGMDITATGNYEEVSEVSGAAYAVIINGLTGGHSGMDIHRGRGNANKLMNRFLKSASDQFDIAVASVEGGGLRNAIPRESHAVIIVPEKNNQAFADFAVEYSHVIAAEYAATDPNISCKINPCALPERVMRKTDQVNLLRAIYACPVGIYRMSPDIDGLVQTSNNLARVVIAAGKYSIQCLTRSSVDSEKIDEANAIKSIFEMLEAEVTFSGDYPGWVPRPGAEIVSIMSALYEEMFRSKPHVMACHAGLECGILGTNYPKMEMISFGPNIKGAHSPDEKVQITSVQKYWKFLLETLNRIPERVS